MLRRQVWLAVTLALGACGGPPAGLDAEPLVVGDSSARGPVPTPAGQGGELEAAPAGINGVRQPASGVTLSAGRPVLRLCTGEVGNAYHTAGLRLAEGLAGAVEVEVVASAGSWENLAGIDAQPRRCDAIIAQDDADALYHFEKSKSRAAIERVGTLYPEYAHFICNRAAVRARNLAGLHPQRHRVVIDQYGSGTFITWRLFGRLSPALARLKSSEASLDDALAMVVAGREAQCMMAVSALGRGIAALADQRHGNDLVLLSVDDIALERPVGRDRRPVYRIATVPADAYRDLSPGPWRTVAVEAVFFISSAWRTLNPAAAEAVAAALPGCCAPEVSPSRSAGPWGR